MRFAASCAAVALVGSMVAGCSDCQDSNNADGGSIVPISTANAGDGTSCGASDTRGIMITSGRRGGQVLMLPPQAIEALGLPEPADPFD